MGMSRSELNRSRLPVKQQLPSTLTMAVWSPSLSRQDALCSYNVINTQLVSLQTVAGISLEAMIVCLLVTAGINSDVSYLSFQIQVNSIFTSDSCVGKMKSLFQEGRGMREASLGYTSPCLKTKVKPTWRLPAQSALCSVRVRPPNGWLT